MLIAILFTSVPSPVPRSSYCYINVNHNGMKRNAGMCRVPPPLTRRTLLSLRVPPLNQEGRVNGTVSQQNPISVSNGTCCCQRHITWNSPIPRRRGISGFNGTQSRCGKRGAVLVSVPCQPKVVGVHSAPTGTPSLECSEGGNLIQGEQFHCDTALASQDPRGHLGPLPAALRASVCEEGREGRPTCPWGSRRVI